MTRDLAIGPAGEPLSVEGLPPGRATWRLAARRPDGGRYEVTFTAAVTAGETTRVELDLRQAPLLPPEAP